MLNQQDKLALEMIFNNDSQLCTDIKKRIYGAVSINREETGSGFYSTIKLTPPLHNIPDIKMWEFNFKHPNFPDGGSYMCSIVNEFKLELEAVTLGGAVWPNPDNANLFEEL